MEDPPGTIARPRELLLVSLAGLALAILMTWPLATGLGHLGRTLGTDADGQFSIWNIAWVARTLVADPLHLFDANIFYPHKTTLAYSEANLLPGAIGIPVYWALAQSVADAERRAARRVRVRVRRRVSAAALPDRRSRAPRPPARSSTRSART